jgi:Protein of unknown function (DUF3455)
MRMRLVQLFGLSALATLASAQPTGLIDVPQAIKPPPGEEVVLQAHASGVQIYVCALGNDRQAHWVLKGPEAQLYDRSGAVIGRHYAGPAWKYSAGSEVRGRVTGQVASPVAGSVPWLLLIATDHSGEGVLARVTSIQRMHTKGGQPPSSTDCASSSLGVEARSNYTADYYFYSPTRSPRSRDGS